MGSVWRGRGVYELNITDENKTDPLLISFMLFSDMLWTFNSFKEMFYTPSLSEERQRMFQFRLIVGFTCEAQKACLIFRGENDNSGIYKKEYNTLLNLLSIDEKKEYDDLLGAFKNQFNEIDLRAYQLKTARNIAFHFASEDSKLSAYVCGAELIYQDIGTEYEIPITYSYERIGNIPTPIIDWYSRQIVDYEISYSLEKEFVLRCLRRALCHRTPEIINSDQGSHFTNQSYLDLLDACQIRISMDGKGQALDNIRTERFFRTIKYDDIYIKEYITPKEMIAGVNNYMTDYNAIRPHASLGGLTPNDVCQQQSSHYAA